MQIEVVPTQYVCVSESESMCLYASRVFQALSIPLR